MDRIAPQHRPEGKAGGWQKWRDLLFVHFEVPAASVRPLLPADLELDLWEGRCLVGVVPFAMRDVRPWWAPRLPGVSNFLELNVRTYVHRGGKPGVWFFSLEAASTVAVYAARWGWGLPYHRASMTLTKEGEAEGARIRYASRRLFPGPTPATCDADYRVGKALGVATPGTFEHFLAERYYLFARHRRGILRGQVHHTPYPLHEAFVDRFDESMLRAAGIEADAVRVHALYSPGVDVEVFSLVPAGGAEG